MRKAAKTLALAVTAVLSLSGCLPPDLDTTPTPLPSSTPVFASEEDALEAAETAYREYQAAVDHALATYDTVGLEAVAVGDALEQALESVASFEERERRLIGTSAIDSITLVHTGDLLTGGDGSDPLQIYGCLDISGTDVVDSTGAVVTPSRPERLPMLVSAAWDQTARILLIAGAEVWDGDDFC